MRTINVRIGLAGLLSCVLAISLYAAVGFRSYLWLFWLFGCAAMLYAAFRWQPRAAVQPESAARLNRRDAVIALGFVVVFAPLYMYKVHDFPRQMNTDEIAIMATAKTLASAPNTDIFAPSYYSDLPGFIFWGLGEMGMLLGGVNLGNMRLLHAASGVLIIALCYVLMRMLKLPRYAAITGTAVIGLNHSLFFLSRMAMRDNTALLFELVALILLLYGWQRRHYGWTLLGGFAAGFTWYTYYPSRITIVLWLLFVGLAILLPRIFRRPGLWSGSWTGLEPRTAVTLAATALIGLLIIAAPLFIANSKHVSADPYPDQQFLWQKAARQQEQSHRGTATELEAVKINMHNGLLAFNQPYTDQGMIYPHPGYGFVDNVTGVLIWVGLGAVAAVCVLRRRITEGELLAVTSFLVIWLSLALLLTRAPDYTRLLIILPFVAYLIGRAAQGWVWLLCRFPLYNFMKNILPWGVSAIIILAVAAANLQIVQDFRARGDQSGDAVGDTLRFQEQRAQEYAKWVYVPGNPSDYYWGVESYWQFWLGFGKGDTQESKVAYSSQLFGTDGAVSGAELAEGQKGYLLTTGAVWQTISPQFRDKWKVLAEHPLDRAGNRIAVTYVSK